MNIRRSVRVPWIIGTAALLTAVVGHGRADDPVNTRSPDVTEAPAYDQFYVIPLRVHILKSEEVPELDCTLEESDIRRILGKVNGIWNKAGIHFGLESVRCEPAENVDLFRQAIENAGSTRAELFRLVLPRDSRHFDGLHVYYVHEFNVNGIYLGRDYALVKVTASLRPVPGGIDEPIPRVTSHELGHALGLPHRQDRTNLLASGTTGTILNADEVDRARTKVRSIKGAQSVPDLKDAAESAEKQEDLPKAKRIWAWLAEIPGEGASNATDRRDALKDIEDKNKAKESKGRDPITP